jgi:hypothetical protein
MPLWTFYSRGFIEFLRHAESKSSEKRARGACKVDGFTIPLGEIKNVKAVFWLEDTSLLSHNYFWVVKLVESKRQKAKWECSAVEEFYSELVTRSCCGMNHNLLSNSLLCFMGMSGRWLWNERSSYGWNKQQGWLHK